MKKSITFPRSSEIRKAISAVIKEGLLIREIEIKPTVLTIRPFYTEDTIAADQEFERYFKKGLVSDD